jgi:hypothetical protein
LLAVSAAAHLLQQHSSSNPSSSLRFFEPVWQVFILRCLLHSHDSTNTCSIFTCRVIITRKLLKCIAVASFILLQMSLPRCFHQANEKEKKIVRQNIQLQARYSNTA